MITYPMVMAIAGLFSISTSSSDAVSSAPDDRGVNLHILGVAQDAGYPQAGCFKPHCMPGWVGTQPKRSAVSLGLIDHDHKTRYMFEATPNFPDQYYRLNSLAPNPDYSMAGIFLTHAHIGHYTGLMYLGREAMGADKVPVFAMPKMRNFIETSGPWSQLVALGNIALQDLADNTPEVLGSVTVTPFLVPHRDEYSETVGYKISGPEKTALFIPDIDKWNKWDVDLIDLIKSVDYAFLDASFFADGELPGRDMSQIPHPFVVETMAALQSLSAEQRAKVWFIHMNHTNPLLWADSAERSTVQAAGFNVASEGQVFPL